MCGGGGGRDVSCVGIRGGLMRCRLCTCRYMWRTNEMRAVLSGVGCVGIRGSY